MYSVVAFAAPFIYKLFTGGNRNDDEVQADEYVEGVVCNDSEVGENQMKQVDLEDVGKVLLIRKNGKLSALGAKCTHYGAPLHAGALGENRVRCQWHGACFNVLTGDIEDFPGTYTYNTIINNFCLCVYFTYRIGFFTMFPSQYYRQWRGESARQTYRTRNLEIRQTDGKIRCT